MRNERIKKPETISRPEQERDTINKSLLSVQKLSQRKIEGIWLSSMRKKKVGGGNMLREGHIRREWGRRCVRKK